MDIKTNSVSATIEAVPFTTKVTAGSHVITADEPADHGGAGKGMKPHDLLLAALASCTCITIKMYADRKGWQLEQVTAGLSMERKIESGIQSTRIVQELAISGQLDEAMINRLIEIGGRCPVHKTLAPAISIVTKLKI